jgi:hypothetical protein
MEIFLHSFLNSALDGDDFSFIAPTNLNPGIIPILIDYGVGVNSRAGLGVFALAVIEIQTD